MKEDQVVAEAREYIKDRRNKIFIDIPYGELKKAITTIEKKVGICKILPHGRFLFDFVADCGLGIHRVEERDGQEIKFDLIVCEALGGESTGTSAKECRNCVVKACKHEHTTKEKCTAEECPDYGKYHIKCLDCGTYVDILKRKEKQMKKLRKNLLKEII